MLPQSRVERPLLVFLVVLVVCVPRPRLVMARHGVVLPPQLAEKLILACSNQRSECLHLPGYNNSRRKNNGAAYPGT